MEELFPNQKLKKGPDTLKSEHLIEGARAIFACVGTEGQFTKYYPEEKGTFSHPNDFNNSPETHNIDYHENSESLKQKKFKNAGEESYVISTVDGSNKSSTLFYDCTGLVVAGQDKLTGKNISLLSHQDPKYFLKEYNSSRFRDDLKEKLLELKKRCKEGTVDAIVIGGRYYKEDKEIIKKDWEKYRDSINLLSQEVLNDLGFKPVIMTGPKLFGGGDSIYYNNGRRALYIIRPDVGNSSTESFSQDDLNNQKEKWEKEKM